MKPEIEFLGLGVMGSSAAQVGDDVRGADIAKLVSNVIVVGRAAGLGQLFQPSVIKLREEITRREVPGAGNTPQPPRHSQLILSRPILQATDEIVVYRVSCMEGGFR
jgi:hypothetical protein